MSAQGSRSRVAYASETTWGVNAAGSPIVGSPDPGFQTVPFVSFGLNLTKDIYQDDTVRSNRRREFNVHGNRNVAGDLTVNLASTSFDDWIASALNSDWAANSITDGTTEKSFTVEHGALDINQYRVFTGVKVNTFNLSVPVNGIVTATFGCLGKDMEVRSTPVDATVTDPSIERPFFHAGGTFSVDSDTTCRLSAIDLTLDNEGQTNFCLGSDSGRDITEGFTTVTGSITAYFDDADYYNKFLNQDTFEVSFTLTDGTNTQTYTLPTCKFDGVDTTIEGQGPILLNVPFSAFSNGGAEIIQIDRA